MQGMQEYFYMLAGIHEKLNVKFNKVTLQPTVLLPVINRFPKLLRISLGLQEQTKVVKHTFYTQIIADSIPAICKLKS